jgi:hypothetical protein
VVDRGSQLWLIGGGARGRAAREIGQADDVAVVELQLG